MKKIALFISLTFIVSACQQQQSPQPASTPKAVSDQPANPIPPRSAEQMFEERLDQILAGTWRSAENKARDPYRHPKETLNFFGIKPGQNVIEITPGSGWYTEVLAPLLKGNGKLIAAVVDPATASSEGRKEYLTKSNAKYREKLSADAERYSEVEVREFSMTMPKLGDDGSVDMVVTFRNVHNFMMWNNDKAMFQAFFKVLKPGGVLGVTDHRAAAGADLTKIKDSGYIPEDYVIQLATEAGFKLEAKSEINANPKDTKDHPEGVWNLPPSLRGGDQNKEKYLAMGESDRMTLKFIKPKADHIFKAPEDGK